MPAARQNAVRELAVLLDGDPQHGRQVARTAVALFDATQKLHGLGPAGRQLLECAALLHDVGNSVNRVKHQRHSQYLILHSSLPGFEREEVRWIATMARFHRGAAPKPTHDELSEFEPDARRALLRLSAILRIADGLDRSHRSIVRSLTFIRRSAGAAIEVDTAGKDAMLELWAASRKADLWKLCFGAEIVVQVRASDRRRSARPHVTWARERPGLHLRH